jgi:diaminohydroxyphosphoribosylaminopyrimidine deaminase/5-amino-6-(5-phosphoribosylamino)uracil reductase
MRRALELAWRGWGRVAPNPLVGAVLLRDGAVVGEGWHAQYGEAHAESVALRAAGDRARGATAVVTLEPSAHTGQQPPCVESLIGAGVARVVAAVPDPNPVAMGGADRLRAAGVEVDIGLGADAARVQNAIFLHRFAVPERPFVALKLATTLDGRIADRNGRSRWISGPEARDFVHWLRAGFDAIGVGAHTARLDDSSLRVRGSVEPRRAPTRVLFSRHGEVPLTLSAVRDAGEVPTVVVTSGLGPAGRQAALSEAGVTVRRVASLADGLRALRQLGIDSLLVEGGGRLAGALLSAGLVDRYYWIQSPVWIGHDGISAVEGLPGRALAEAERWSAVERKELGQDTLLVLDREPCSPES